jgi:hypothetical protein
MASHPENDRTRHLVAAKTSTAGARNNLDISVRATSQNTAHNSDEIWTAGQVMAVHQMFINNPDRTAGWYWCWYFVGPEKVITRHGGCGYGVWWRRRRSCAKDHEFPQHCGVPMLKDGSPIGAIAIAQS